MSPGLQSGPRRGRPHGRAAASEQDQSPRYGSQESEDQRERRLWWRERWMGAVWASSLRPLEKLVAAVYADHARSSTVAWVATERLMHCTGLSRDAAVKALKGLRQAGWLVPKEPVVPRRPIRFRLVVPDNQLCGGPCDGPPSKMPGPPRGPRGEVGGPRNGLPDNAGGPSHDAGGPSRRPDLTTYPTTHSTVPTGVIDDTDGRSRCGEHPYEENARKAIATLRVERSLPFSNEALLELAYRVSPEGDPWSGYLAIKSATTASFDGARDARAVLHKRLGVPS